MSESTGNGANPSGDVIFYDPFTAPEAPQQKLLNMAVSRADLRERGRGQRIPSSQRDTKELARAQVALDLERLMNCIL